MPTVGRTTTTGNNQWNSNTGSNNQIGSKFTMPETGLIQALHVYVSGNGGTITGQLVLWDSSGNILGQTGNITFSSGTTGINGQAMQSASLLTSVHVASGAIIYIGFWRASASTANYSWINSGGIIAPNPGGTQANVASPGALAIGSTATGQLTAWADYVKGGLGYYNGTAWNKYALKRWNGSAWQRHPLKKWSGTAWEWFA